MNVEEERANENAQGVAKVEKRREDAHALPKLSQNEEARFLIFAPKYFWSAVPPARDRRF